MLDAENWRIVFKIYAGHPVLAVTLAYQLIAVKQSLQRGQKGIPDAIAGLDLAIDSLYPHTEFNEMGHKLFLRTIEGAITTKEEELFCKLTVLARTKTART